MGKLILIIAGIYVLYYLGNIIYDLFLKKETLEKKEDYEEISLADFAEQNREEIKDIAIEDVENLNTPNSFNGKKESYAAYEENVQNPEEQQSMDHWREKFESEADIDSFDAPEKEQEHEKSENNTLEESGDPETAQEDLPQNKTTPEEKREENKAREGFKKEETQDPKKLFEGFINQAKTKVQVNYQGGIKNWTITN